MRCLGTRASPNPPGSEPGGTAAPGDTAGWGLSLARLFRLPRVGCRSYLVISPVRLPSFAVELLERMLSVACK